MCVFKRDLKVKYLDVNSKSQLTSKGFIKYLQDVANEHSDEIGYGFKNITQTNLSWILLNWKVQILKRPTVSDNIHIITWARVISRAISYRDFEVYDSNNNLICIASSKWALTNYSTHSLERISPEMRNAYGVLEKKVFDVDINEKIKEPENSFFVYEYTIQRRDIDTNNHVNNLCYLDFAYEALPDDVYYNLNSSTTEIIYKKEIKYKDKIKCFYSNTNGKHIVTIKNDDLSIVHSIVSFY